MSSAEKEIKSLKLSLPYVTEDGKMTLREMTVSFKRVIEKENRSYSGNHYPIYSMNMSLVIPDHIHTRLIGTIVGRKRGLGDDKGTTYAADFSKTITSESLKGLTERWRDAIWDYLWVADLDKMEVKRVIFYDFAGGDKENGKSYWDGKKMSNDIEVQYGYMIGYVSSDGKYRLNDDKKVVSDKDGEAYKWKYIDHTKEREIFFRTIFQKFQQLLSQLENFGDSINPYTIDDFVKKGVKLLP